MALDYSKHKLNTHNQQYLQRLLDISYTYTCGSTLAEPDPDEDFKDVEIRDHVCDAIEKLYYSAELEPICIYRTYCGVLVDQPFTTDTVQGLLYSQEPVKK